MTTIGFLIGIGVGLGLFLARRFLWPVLSALNWIVVVMLVVGLGTLAIAVAGAGRSGSEGVTAAMTTVLFGGAALVVSTVCGLIVAFCQAKAVGRTVPTVFATAFLDASLVALIFYGFHTYVFTPRQTEVTQDWWAQEQERRNRVQKLKDEVPETYREIPLHIIDQHNRERAELEKQGIHTQPLVPQDIENKIRNYTYESSKPGPIPNRSRYSEVMERQRGFGMGLGAGWIFGALFIPIGWGLVWPRKADNHGHESQNKGSTGTIDDPPQ